MHSHRIAPSLTPRMEGGMRVLLLWGEGVLKLSLDIVTYRTPCMAS